MIKEKEILINENKKFKNQLNSIFQEKNELNKQIKTLQKEKEQIQCNNQNQINQLQIKFYQNIETILKQKDEEIIDLKTQIKKGNQILNEIKLQNENLKQYNNDHQNKIKEFENSQLNFTQLILEKDQEIYKLKEEKEKLMNENQIINDQLNFIFQEEKDELNKQIEALQKEKEQIHFNSQNQIKKINELQIQLKSY
jgi:epidermal growth factor receptor substrate 15